MRLRFPNLLASAVLALAACGPESAVTATDGDATETASSSSSSTSGVTTVDSTLDPTTGPSSDPSTSETTGEPQFPMCPAGDPAIAVEINVNSAIVSEKSDFDLECAVQAAGSAEISLQCTDMDGAYDVVISLATPSPKTGVLAGHDKVRLRFHQESELGITDRLHVSLHGLDDGALLLFYGQGYDMFVPQFADFWAPLQISEVPLGLCPVEGECDTVERSALEIVTDKVHMLIHDHSVALIVPGLWFYVETAVETVPNTTGECPSDAIAGRRVEVLALAADPV